MKKWLMAAALAVAGLAAADARAQGPVEGSVPAPSYVQGNGSCPTSAPQAAPAPPAQSYGGGYGGYGGPARSKWSTGKLWTMGGLFSAFGGSNISQMPTLPVYMAAPWYLYWPYDGHFQTVAPMAHGLYYPPPMYTGNPYQPGVYPGYVAGSPVPAFPVSPVRP